MRKKTDKYRISAYIRVSSEEQAENPEGSIKNQEQRLRDFAKQRNADGPFGEIVELYCDPGVSAKDMNRPALQAILAAIRRGDTDLVLVTEVSRLTRSMRDFALLWDFLKEHGCQFQSLRDNFDTTTPAGEMILFTLANFAQFERKQLGERISNAFQARAKRGLWNGGVLPLGYEFEPGKPGRLKILEAEAEIVRETFSTFLREETLSRTARRLNENGLRLPKKPRNGGSFRHAQFTIEAVYRILTNRAYLAKRVFMAKDGEKEADAAWEPIVDETTFGRVQAMLAKNKSRKKPPSATRYPYLLSGLVLCKACGGRMGGKSAHGNGGKIGYYEHTWATKTQNGLATKSFGCDPHRVLAKKIEPVVWADVKRLLANESYARAIFEEATAAGNGLQVAEVERLKARIATVSGQLAATAERITELPKGVDANVFYDQLRKLQNTKEDLETALAHAKAQELNRESAITTVDFGKFTEDLKKLANQTIDPDVQASICRKLIQKVEVSAQGIAIHYYVGDRHYENELGQAHAGGIGIGTTSSSQGLAGKPAGPFLFGGHRLRGRPLEKHRIERRSAVAGSASLTNGSKRRT